MGIALLGSAAFSQEAYDPVREAQTNIARKRAAYEQQHKKIDEQSQVRELEKTLNEREGITHSFVMMPGMGVYNLTNTAPGHLHTYMLEKSANQWQLSFEMVQLGKNRQINREYEHAPHVLNLAEITGLGQYIVSQDTMPLVK